MNLYKFIKDYLQILAIPVDQLDDYAGKVLVAAILSVLARGRANDIEENKIKNIGKLYQDGKVEDASLLIQSVFDHIGKETMLDSLTDQLAKLTDTLGENLDGTTKQKLADMVSALS